jgi:hypothetical protein
MFGEGPRLQRRWSEFPQFCRVDGLPSADRATDHPPVSPSFEVPMQLTVRTLLLIIAVILFVVYALGVRTGDVSLLGLGLAFFAGAFLVPDTVLGTRR